VGSGVEETIVGPAVYASGFTDYGFGSDYGAAACRIENLRIENQNYRGLGMLNASVELIDCVIERCYLGVQLFGDTENIVIDRCQFLNGPNQSGSSALSCAAPHVEIRDTDLIGYKTGFNLDYTGATDVLVTGCTFDANSTAFNYGLVGLQFTFGSGGTVENCYFREWNNYAFVVNDAGSVIFRNNVIERCAGAGVGLNGCTEITMHDNIISSSQNCVFVGEPSGAQSIHNNHFFRSVTLGGDFVRTTGYYPFGPYDLDFTENYWGTTDVDYISQWIYDGHDDEDVWMYVIFEPMADGPVSVEEKSWSDVKSLYRE
jgi:hypothetical protein